MSRKEHDIYTWSSDDEDPPGTPSIPDVHILRGHSNEPRPSIADMPGTSGQPGPSSPLLSPSRRNQNRMDRDLFLSLLSNQHKVPDVSRVRNTSSRSYEFNPKFVAAPISWGPVTHTPPSELREARARATAEADLERLLPYKRLMRSYGGLRSSKSNANLYAVSSRVPPRNSVLVSAGLADAPGAVRPARVQSALKRLQQVSRSALRWENHRSVHFGGTVMIPNVPRARAQPVEPPPAPRSPDSALSALSVHAARAVDWDEPVVVDEPEPAALSADEVMELPDNNDSPQPASIEREIETVEPELIDVDMAQSSSTGVSLEEEIVEIDAPDEPEAEVSVTGDDAAANVVTADVGLNEAAATPVSDDAVVLQQPSQENTSSSNKRRRDAHASSYDDGEPYTVKEFNQSLLRLLECPVCLEWMEPPMSQCRRGHLVCARCRARLASCPVCRTTFSSVRNRAMEGVAEMVRYPCRHGCGREVRLRRRAGHESSCSARRYQCPAPACADRPPLPRDHLHQHFQGKHMPLLKIGRKHKFSMKVNSEQHDTWLITALQEYFYLRVDVDIRTWGVVVYVAYIGPKCNAKNYTYEVSVVGQHSARRLVYARATHSDLESSTLNVSRQDCFHLTLDQALNFLRFKNRHCEAEKFLDFNVEINKNEPNGRDDSDS